MRNPEKVLISLTAHSKLSDYKFERLYRILFNEEMYYVAYQNINAKPGNMTNGTDSQTIDEMSLSRIEKLIEAIRNESYQPRPSRRTYIPKKNGKKRPLGIPVFDDKLVQEVIRMILEAIYEGSFEHTSHGFRPQRSCHTALMQISKSFNGAKWFIEGDIKGFFDNINHDVLINILQERISDERFIRLIRKFLNAGYMEDWVYHKTYSGTPQGGIVSPILANIYLDRLDKYVKDYINRFDLGEGRTPSRERNQLEYDKRIATQMLKAEDDATDRKLIGRRIKEIDRKRALIPSCDEMDAGYKRLKYVRYADDFLIGVIGSLDDCKRIKQDISNFLNEQLQLTLSDEKTLITHTEKPARFLSFDITVRKSNLTKRNVEGKIRRAYHKKVVLKIPPDTIKQKLLDYDVLEIKLHNGKEQWKPKHRKGLIFNDDLEILSKYNAELIGFYNYYSIALNAGTVNNFKYIMEYSMYKTFAGKYRTTVPNICRKYKKDGVFTVSYTNTKRQQRFRTFYNDGFKRKTEAKDAFFDKLPNYYHAKMRTSLIDRLKARNCELCGETSELEMHHVRKLKDVAKGKDPWEVHMIARKRKTMAVCHTCHMKIHHGK
ncbi:reverse transcriptase domain-containing protein [Mucilaginibacter sp. PAMB04274]|uniref:reverse transcriptase/maturase family protein n=1 Tax=Mucilaginibacter sp. PAMB04274 TaxID=3138568 RepID=UPI0031F60813